MGPRQSITAVGRVTRRPAHTGEHVVVEPLAVFLRRDFWMRSGCDIPAAPAWSPSLDDYDTGRVRR